MSARQVTLERRFHVVAHYAAGLAMAVGALVLAGWNLGAEGFFGWRNTNPITATTLLLLALAVWLRCASDRPWRAWASRFLAALTLALGLVCFAENFGLTRPGLSTWVAAGFGGRTDGDLRMSTYTALCIVLLSTAVFAVGMRPHQKQCPGQWLALAAIWVSILVLIGHAYGVHLIRVVTRHAPMGIPSAIAVFLSGVAVLGARPAKLPVALFARDDPGGYMARRMVPLAFLFPIGLGWARLWGEQQGFYSTALGVAVYATGMILFFAALIAYIASRLSVIDRERAESHALFQAVIANASEFVSVLNRDYRYLAFNEAHAREYEKIYGIRPQIGSSMLDGMRHLPGDLAAAQDIWARALNGEKLSVVQAYGDEHRARRWYEITLSPIRDATDEVVAAAQIVRDMTERWRAQQELQDAHDAAERSRSEQQAVVQSMREGVAIVDATGRLIDMNPSALAFHGYDSCEPLRQPLAELVAIFELRDLAGRVLPVDEWPIARALRGEAFSGVELQVRRRDGSFAIASYAGAPVRDRTGRIILAVATLRDITKERADEEELAAARFALEQHAQALEHVVAERTARLTETVDELERFSYSLSHDLRAPLRAMKGFSQMLQAGFHDKLGADGGLYLDRISAAAGRLDQLIQDVLTYSRIVRQHVPLGPVDVNQLVRQLIDENPGLQPPQAVIEVDAPLLPVLGHEAYLTQALSNLLYNAVKFVRRGEKAIVRIWTERRGPRVRLSVRDRGIGIPAEAQPRLFGMFERLNNEYDGTGIGLSIVKKATQRMSGDVGVESEEGKGSTFWIELPAATP